MEITLTAPAKVNLTLVITGRRADGYHELVTLMQPLTLADELVLGLEGPDWRFMASDPELSQDNLVEKAARAFYAKLDKKPVGYAKLNKKIPVAAGLGGGSSDAAAALMGLNQLWGYPMSPAELADLAVTLGADVPFFLEKQTCLCRGIGQESEPWPDFPELDYVLVKPGFKISTAWAYQQYDLAWTKTQPPTTITSLNAIIPNWENLLYNDLERVAWSAYPALSEIKQQLRAQGSLGVLMTGSGPTVFGVFADAQQANKAATALAEQSRSVHAGWQVITCRGITDYRS